MPQLQDLLVQVTVNGLNEHGYSIQRPLEEWGVHRMKGMKKISAYIEAETGKSFQISIQPKIPYPSKGVAAHDYHTRERARARKKGLETDKPGFFKMEDQWQDEDGKVYTSGERILSKYCDYMADKKAWTESRESRQSSDPEFSHEMTKIKNEPQDDPTSFSSPIRSTGRMIKRTPPPPFHFLATLFLDGRMKPERKVVIYLDPDDDDYHYPSGEVVISTRWAQGQDGTIKEQAWVFKEVGIETIFDKMLIDGDVDITSPVPKRAEDALIDAMNSTCLDADGDVENEEKSRAGQILVVIEKVKLGEKWRDPNFRAKHNENEMQDVDMGDAGRDITHSAGLTHKKTVAAHPVRVVAYTPYKNDEDSFAVFQFFYRSKATLAKFNFLGFQAGTPRHRSQRNIDAALTWLTPLSITSNSKARALSGKRKDVSFEEKAKNQTSKDSAPPVLKKIDSPYRQHRKRIKNDDLESLEHMSIKLSDLPLSSASMVTTPCMEDQDVDKENHARHNLRIFSNRGTASPTPNDATNANKFSLSEIYLSTSLLNSGPAAQNTPFSDSEENTAIDTGTAKRIGRTTPHSSAFTVECDVSDAEAAIESWREKDECQPVHERDDQAPSAGVKQLVLGKREQLNDDAEEKDDGAKIEEDDSSEGKLISYNLGRT